MYLKSDLKDNKIQLPVLESFDISKPIGYVILDKSNLPEVPYYHLSLGYKLLDIETGKHELVCLGLVKDSDFKAYEPYRKLNAK